MNNTLEHPELVPKAGDYIKSELTFTRAFDKEGRMLDTFKRVWEVWYVGKVYLDGTFDIDVETKDNRP